jgi:hypothetical protein
MESTPDLLKPFSQEVFPSKSTLAWRHAYFQVFDPVCQGGRQGVLVSQMVVPVTIQKKRFVLVDFLYDTLSNEILI